MQCWPGEKVPSALHLRVSVPSPLSTKPLPHDTWTVLGCKISSAGIAMPPAILSFPHDMDEVGTAV
eukprot:2850289-Rhodomonas_salina.1